MKKSSRFPTIQGIKPKFIPLLAAVSILLWLFTGCKKKIDTPPPNNNEMKATVIVSSGSTINIDAAGSKAAMGCSLFGGGTFVSGTNPDNAAAYISYVHSAGLSCITSPGTYNFSCEYRKNIADPNTPIYSNIGINRGNITFTVVNDHYMEGYFNAVSWCNSPGCAFRIDSVIIAGTFKGNY